MVICTKFNVILSLIAITYTINLDLSKIFTA